jgi:hypothetical protein
VKQVSRCLQLVLKQELDRNELTEELKQDLVHVGLGHSVFSVDPQSRGHIDELISNYSEDKYYFRMSFVEDLTELNTTTRSYLTHDGKFLKPKVNGNVLYFLGLDFVVIEIEKLQHSDKFGLDNFHCVIRKLTVDASKGTISEEIIWDKTKYGRIEYYLPNKLKAFTSPIYQCRCRLLKKKG